MNTFVFGVGLFVVAFCVHVTIWRICLPRREWRALILVFITVTILGLILVLFSQHFGDTELTIPRLVLAGFVFWGLAVVYMILFSALEADSPTLTMVQLIYRHRKEGISEGELTIRSAEQAYARLRLEQMLSDGLAEQVGSRVRVTLRGRRFASMVLWYCGLLGLHRITGAATAS